MAAGVGVFLRTPLRPEQSGLSEEILRWTLQILSDFV